MIEVPKGGSFADMVTLKGNKEIGEKINIIISTLAEANDLKGVIDVADFNDDDKLGKDKEMQDRLSKLVGIFESLDFSANRAEGDDLLGDAYEYLMRHFATESGKSKGQFYTPAEVSRIVAQVVGIGPKTRQRAFRIEVVATSHRCSQIAVERVSTWAFPWASSLGSDFNSDYSVGFSPEEQPRNGGIEYNFRREDAWKPSSGSKPRDRAVDSQSVFGTGVNWPIYLRERPGVSAFALEDSVVYQTCSTYARGLDALWGMWQWLDRAPKGRNQTGSWWRRHDEYDGR
ncbi:MAG TPA: DUF899 family protein [Terracidiphilus sp.]